MHDCVCNIGGSGRRIGGQMGKGGLGNQQQCRPRSHELSTTLTVILEDGGRAVRIGRRLSEEHGQTRIL